MDQRGIHEDYNNGDFDKVIAGINRFSLANKTFTRLDSIFIAKHLAVVYMANPQTREIGKHQLVRLLQMMPSADLVDMFVSDEVDRIFDKVRKEYLVRQASFGVDTATMRPPQRRTAQDEALPKASPPIRRPSAGPGKPWWRKETVWIAGGVGLAVTGALLAYLSLQEDGKVETISVPSENR